MNNGMFRARRKDNNEYVYGWLVVDNIAEKYWMTDGCHFGGDFAQFEVFPETLSMKTFQLDKNKEMIYGSFELEGFGMTNGGDVVYDEVNKSECDIVMVDGAFCMENLGDDKYYRIAGIACDLFIEIIK